MNDLTGPLPPDLLQAIDEVLVHALPHASGLAANDVMVVGATCRDLHHHALGHQFQTAATHDLDLALALNSWDAFQALSEAFVAAGESGIRFTIAGVTVDLLPFGDIERPAGVATPPARATEPMGVWALREVYDNALDLALPSGATVKLPTVAGYAATKFGAWLDRSAVYETKDARDIALALYWFTEANEVCERVFDTENGQAIYLLESGDVVLSCAHMLGRDVFTLVGNTRLGELLERWPGDDRLFARELTFTGGSWPTSIERREQLLAALTRGLNST